MSGLRLYCRGCCKFISGRLSTCGSCGHEHTREHPALEEPIPFRRQPIPKRDGWEFLLGRR